MEETNFSKRSWNPISLCDPGWGSTSSESTSVLYLIRKLLIMSVIMEFYACMASEAVWSEATQAWLRTQTAQHSSLTSPVALKKTHMGLIQLINLLLPSYSLQQKTVNYPPGMKFHNPLFPPSSCFNLFCLQCILLFVYSLLSQGKIFFRPSSLCLFYLLQPLIPVLSHQNYSWGKNSRLIFWLNFWRNRVLICSKYF